LTKWLLRRCVSCGRYTLKTECPYCGGEVRVPHPAKFSIDDKYAKYRVKMRMEAKLKDGDLHHGAEGDKPPKGDFD